MPTVETQENKPRFDFDRNIDTSETQIGTLKELLAEINVENQAASGTVVDIKSLGPTLRFIAQFTGRTYESTTEPLPLATLKIIKLLYTKNDESGIQLFRCLARPGNGEEPTMEFRITDGSTRNEYLVKVSNEILEALALEISDTRLRWIETLLVTRSKFLEFNEREIAEILEPIHRRFHGNNEAIARSLRFVTASIVDYEPKGRKRESPVHEQVYVYLRTLPLFHWVGEYTNVLELAKIDIPVKPIRGDIEHFCKTLSSSLGGAIGGRTPVTSIDGFPAFGTEHASAFGKLIKAATGIQSEKRDLIGILNEANKVLHAYVFRRWHRTAPDAINLSVADCVAALCTIRHQQKVKTTYSPFWIGQEANERSTTRLLSHLGGDRPIAELYEHDYIPEGAAQILHYRFGGFYAAILDHVELHQAELDFEEARIQRYADCHASSDADYINSAVANFNRVCADYAIQAELHVAATYASQGPGART